MREYCFIALVALLVHGLLLLNDGLYWDGWLIYTGIREGNWKRLHVLSFDRGAPTDFLYFVLLSHFKNILLGCRVVVFTCIILTAYAIFRACSESTFLSRRESLFVALISITYPAFQTWAELSTGHYVVYYTLFWLASLSALGSERSRGVRRIVLRCLALAAFFLSFGLNSLLVFYAGFVFLLLFVRRRKSCFNGEESILEFLPRCLDFLVLPFLYWTAKQCLFPRFGLFADYNKFQLGFLSVGRQFASFFYHGIYTQLNDSLQLLLIQPALILLGWGACRWWAASVGPRINEPSNGFPTAASKILFFGLGLLSLAMLPYALVGRSPSSHGYSTRHALLLGFPLALILVSTARLAFCKEPGILPGSWAAFLRISVLLFGAATIRNHFSFQARWVKVRSVMMNLAQITDAGKYSIFWVKDRFREIPLRLDNELYSYHEWSSIFKTLWGNERRIGIDERGKGARSLSAFLHFKDFFNLSDFNPAGCQAVLTITPGTAARGDGRLARGYLFYKYFDKDKLDGFLRQVTVVQVEARQDPRATDCQLSSNSPPDRPTRRTRRSPRG